MSTKIDDTIKSLIDEGRKAGFLTVSGMTKLMEDQFVPLDQMDQVFFALDEAGIDVVEDDDVDTSDKDAISIKAGDGLMGKAKEAAPKKATKKAAEKTVKADMPEKIDDPVRMYLTQMGEIPLLTRPEEIYLAKTIEITRKRFRKKAMGSGFCMDESVATVELVQEGKLAFDRTLKVNPNPKADDDPKIVETLGKQFLAKRLPVNMDTIRTLLENIRTEYVPLQSARLSKADRAKQLEKVQNIRRKLVILSVAPVIAHCLAQLAGLPPPEVDPSAPVYSMHGLLSG